MSHPRHGFNISYIRSNINLDGRSCFICFRWRAEFHTQCFENQSLLNNSLKLFLSPHLSSFGEGHILNICINQHSIIDLLTYEVMFMISF